MEMCDRKYMFGDKSTFGSSWSKPAQKKINKKYFFFLYTHFLPLLHLKFEKSLAFFKYNRK